MVRESEHDQGQRGAYRASRLVLIILIIRGTADHLDHPWYGTEDDQGQRGAYRASRMLVINKSAAWCCSS